MAHQVPTDANGHEAHIVGLNLPGSYVVGCDKGMIILLETAVGEFQGEVVPAADDSSVNPRQVLV